MASSSSPDRSSSNNASTSSAGANGHAGGNWGAYLGHGAAPAQQRGASTATTTTSNVLRSLAPELMPRLRRLASLGARDGANYDVEEESLAASWYNATTNTASAAARHAANVAGRQVWTAPSSSVLVSAAPVLRDQPVKTHSAVLDELLRLDVPRVRFLRDFHAGRLTNGATASDDEDDEVGEHTGALVPLIDGFKATAPAVLKARKARRQRRAHLADSRLLLTSREHGADEAQGGAIGAKELARDKDEIKRELEGVQARRALARDEARRLAHAIQRLTSRRDEVLKSLLALKEEELELQDEMEGVTDLLGAAELSSADKVEERRPRPRHRGPALLPSEHDELPPGIAFMTLNVGEGPVTALDFANPYGLAVTACGPAQAEGEGAAPAPTSAQIWDLATGAHVGALKHGAQVKALQVEKAMCITGGTDGRVRVWDLDRALLAGAGASPDGSPDGSHYEQEDDVFQDTPTPQGCTATLAAHTKAVTSLYFDKNDMTLVTGSADRTLRQFDLNAQRCVQTMDVVWATSNPLARQTLASPARDDDDDDIVSPFATPMSSVKRRPVTRRPSGYFGLSPQPQSHYTPVLPTTPSKTPSLHLDKTWDSYEDFVGAVQFWGYALASGTGDGCVRMWDMRTGQAHRTLVGHTAPVTCLQFDEYHLVSGARDRAVRVWDLRTGGIVDTLRYDGPVTSVQFDSRKIVAAAGDEAVHVYNRTTMQHTQLAINGHAAPIERLRFVDRYLVTGSKDCTVKVWAL